jgi:hypothetical protein
MIWYAHHAPALGSLIDASNLVHRMRHVRFLFVSLPEKLSHRSVRQEECECSPLSSNFLMHDNLIVRMWYANR